ncbi:hypothetical protein BQ8794_50022 [Mesorhizobium prunaredense]|uniref:Uncharacterized protein n=1 Tax=Mesorhizobium prunaredense TaxID=1631249 RepID=A0A1R3VF82_9HYPH|nr:hypothetical protein BQ8794_50022 [Mesorhizobium prunaredense]
MLDVFIIEAIFDLKAHDITHLRVRSLTQCYAADRDISIGDHPDQPVVVAHGHHSGVKPAHNFSYFTDGLFGVGDLDIPRHAVADFHGNLP